MLQGQNADPAKYEKLRAYVTGVLTDVLPDGFVTDDTKVYINPTGAFEFGGPVRRRGPHRPQDHRRHLRRRRAHGGRWFSGKDPTQVDRSAAYVARYLAKNVVAAGLAKRCTIQLVRDRHRRAAVGLCRHHGTGTVAEDKLEAVLPQLVRLSPKGIRQHLKLNAPIYVKSAAYGHFGREPEGDLFTGKRPIWSTR